jgi:2-dehydro-3-deoxygluconokinase
MTAPLRIACIGECMIELSDLDAADGRVAAGVAGDTLNTAVYLARALPRDIGRVGYVTALGQDALSDRMLDFMAEHGLDTAAIARLPDRLPGLYAIETDQAGERRFHYWRDGSAARAMFRPGALSPEMLAQADVIYLSGITLAILPEGDRDALMSVLERLGQAGRQIVFDSNHRPRLWPDAETARRWVTRGWQAAGLALPSLDDETALFGADDAAGVLARIAALGPAEIALKRGADGPLLHHQGRVLQPDCPATTDVVDTTAAGDSFNAGYLAARLTGAAPADAARAGHELACRVIARPGAIIEPDP